MKRLLKEEWENLVVKTSLFNMVKFNRQTKQENENKNFRLSFLRNTVAFFLLLITIKLFFLQVIDYEMYAKAAENRHNIYLDLLPRRGQIYFQNLKNPEEITPAALNKDIYIVFVDPKIVKDSKQDVKNLAQILAQKLEINEQDILTKITKERSRYEVIKKRVSSDIVDELKLENLGGVYFDNEPSRFYPEKNLASQTLGYLGYNKKDLPQGYYGLEGYLNELLSGTSGYLSTEKSAGGGWITLLPRNKKSAVDGADVVLTIDRTLEYVACEALKNGVAKLQAKGGTVIIMNPKDGAVLALCNEPNFDPNNYSLVTDLNLFNNDSIFTPYEPGSVFKVITMAGALDAGKVTPDTTFVDTGMLRIGPDTIRNAGNKSYGLQNMTGVLRDSINTGAVFAAEKLGLEKFKKYVQDFGFGVLTGLELDEEVPGNINSLNNKKPIYLATASFGQGLTTTPIQLISSYAAVANKGLLYKPYVVSEVRYSDGHKEKTKPRLVKQVISERTARILSAMMVVVVEEGHGKAAGVKGYHIAGKTGTAQIPSPDGKYSESATNQTFIGFGPVDDPQFVMLVKYVEPQVNYAESSAVPTFGEIAKFLVQYLEIPPTN